MPDFARRLSLVFERERRGLRAAGSCLRSSRDTIRDAIRDRSALGSVRGRASPWPKKGVRRWRESAMYAWVVSLTVHGAILAFVLAFALDAAPKEPKKDR